MKSLSTKLPIRSSEQREQQGRSRPIPPLATKTPLLQRQCACGGSCPRCQEKLGIQTQLSISEPGDPYEQEADRVADAVVTGQSKPYPISQGIQPKLYRVEMRPEDAVDSMLPGEEENQAASSSAFSGNEAVFSENSVPEELQRSASGTADIVDLQFEQSLQQAVQREGQALPTPVQNLMENRFGWDFSAVRVHHDRQANILSQQVNARAFTLGNDIFFARSQYQPESLTGQHLLAHELTHVIQQSKGQVSRQIQLQGQGLGGGTRCSSYSNYDTSVDLNSYNCAGLALRTYQYISPSSAVYAAINANFILPQCPVGNTCAARKVKFWLWEYNLHLEDDQGNVLQPASRDFHIVAGQADASGNDPTNVYSKNGRRPVYGPGTGGSFRPATREQATSNDPSEQPLTFQGRPVYKVRSNMTEQITCAGCYL